VRENVLYVSNITVLVEKTYKMKKNENCS